ncbi:MAG: hypothetical protein LQ339_002680 [Xanthoria mediterranea]|nr:MAG: hypothetical protein LQ339_002680 [Xanthoria mediterranea]
MFEQPIVLMTHPRSCSTAFERAMMAHPDISTCFHEPFSVAFYFGPERLCERYPEHENSTNEDMTYGAILHNIVERASKHQQDPVFIKDFAGHFIPPQRPTESMALSVAEPNEPFHEPSNPCVLPRRVLRMFRFTFLIRHPRFSIPSLYRCTVEPLSHKTGWHFFLPSEAGYAQLRQMFDYLRQQGLLGSNKEQSKIDDVSTANHASSATASNIGKDGNDICLIDAEDLLRDPAATLQAYCAHVGLTFDPRMLAWDSLDQDTLAHQNFDKWKGFHEDAIQSKGLVPCDQTIAKSADEQDREWRDKFGIEGAKVIRETVDANVEHYLYLRQFALRI